MTHCTLPGRVVGPVPHCLILGTRQGIGRVIDGMRGHCTALHCNVLCTVYCLLCTVYCVFFFYKVIELVIKGTISPLKLLCQNTNTIALIRLVQWSVAQPGCDFWTYSFYNVPSQGYSQSKFELYLTENNGATPFSVARREQL